VSKDQKRGLLFLQKKKQNCEIEINEGEKWKHSRKKINKKVETFIDAS
jgi:hypothetical protein